MNLENCKILARVDAEEMIKRLCGITAAEILEQNLLCDMALLIEAELQMRLDACGDGAPGAFDEHSLGLPFPFSVTADGEVVTVLRQRILSAFYRQAAVQRAQAADCSMNFLAEPQRAEISILLVGTPHALRDCFTIMGKEALARFAFSRCLVDFHPRPAGSAAGFEAVLRSPRRIRSDIAALVEKGVEQALTGQVDAVDVLVRSDGIDLSPVLRFATVDERHRLNALRSAADGGVQTNWNNSLRARALKQSLYDRLDEVLTGIGYGQFYRDSAGGASSWNYASKDDASLAAALLPLLGDEGQGVPALADTLFTKVSVVTGSDPLSPHLVVASPETVVDQSAELSHFDVAICVSPGDLDAVSGYIQADRAITADEAVEELPSLLQRILEGEAA